MKDARQSGLGFNVGVLKVKCYVNFCSFCEESWNIMNFTTNILKVLSEINTKAASIQTLKKGIQDVSGNYFTNIL